MFKLYLDEDVHKKVASALRLKGYDVVSAHEIQQQSRSDLQQLVYAAAEQRAIFSFNAGDFDRLHKEYMESGRKHYGVLLSKQLPLSETIKRLAKFLFTHAPENIQNNVFWI